MEEEGVLKKKEKRSKKEKVPKELLEGVPVAPKLEDFQFVPEASLVAGSGDQLHPNEEIKSKAKEPCPQSSPEKQSCVSVSSSSSRLSTTFSSLSLDPCEEAFVEDKLSVSVPPPLAPPMHLYPSVHIIEETPSLTTWENIQSPVDKTKSAQEVVVDEAILPFDLPCSIPESELTSSIQHMYSNIILENAEERLQEFLNSTKASSFDGFELYELLCNYQRACSQLGGCEKALNDLKEKCTELEKRLWSVSHETLNQSSTCMDGNGVTATHQFLVAKFDPQVYADYDKNLKATKEVVKDSFSLFTYSIELCKTQIRHFFSKSFKHMNLQSFEVQGYYSGYPTGDLQGCAGLLKRCISTLFLFLRRTSTHPQVHRDCLMWLTEVTGLLLRIATLDDHFFIVNHVLRCPPGMLGKRLASCVQIPKIVIPSSPEYYHNNQSQGFGHLNLDYALTVLRTMLSRVPKRDEYLKHVESGVNKAATESSSQWVVVDSEGEDDPEDVSFFKESDLVSLLNQIPFSDLFRRILLITNSHDEDVLDMKLATERNVLRLLAFATQFVDVLGTGFVAYYTDRYRQLVKMIGRLILHTVQYTTDYVEALTSNEDWKRCSQNESLILKEYNLFMRSAIGVLFTGKNIGTLQFLAAIPYHLITSDMLWHIYCVITKWVVTDSREIDISSEFENELISMNESDVFYLLTTLCNMATAREDLRDKDFIKIVMLHLFQIGFISPLTRDCCSKTCKDLLGNLTRQDPKMISTLLNAINAKLPILESVALIIMEANTKWERSQYYITEGMKQMNPLFNRSQNNWYWEVLKRLHLHAFDREKGISNFIQKALPTLPTFDRNSELECVRRGVDEKNPIASILALYLTPMGHSVPLICTKGIDLIENMLQFGKLDFVLHALFFIVPLFVEDPETLYSIERFRVILQTLLAADMTYIRMAKNLITTDFPGETTKLMGEMMSAQIENSSRFGTEEKDIVRLWTCALTSLPGWNKDQGILYLMDILAKASLGNEDCDAFFRQYFTEMYKDIPQTSHSGIAALFSWNSSSSSTLLPNPQFAQLPYFLYYILSIEMDLENTSGFWRTLCVKLNNPKVSVDGAVKKASNATKFSGSTNYLTVYRWAQLALELPLPHELSFLVWQKFFLRYFHRVSGNQTTHYSCVASRFFEGIINTSFYNKTRRKLMDLQTYCKGKLEAFEQNSQARGDCAENPMVVKELLTDKLNLANAMALWIDDIQLLQPTLYLPALPPQFLPTMLLSLMDGEETSWNNYAELDIVSHEQRASAKNYMSTICRSDWFEGYKLLRHSSLGHTPTNCAEDILKRLKSYDMPRAPPSVPVFEEAIPSPVQAMFVDVKTMKQGLELHVKNLKDFSKSFSLQISQMMALNCAYWECLPELYLNQEAEMVVNARCSGRGGGKGWENCSQPAQIRFKYTEAKLNEALGHQIHQNRTEYQTLLDEKGTKPPPRSVCVAAVFIEDFITNLVLHHRLASSDGNERVKVCNVGSELFYFDTTLVSDNLDFYPPTRQLFSSLLEVLGNEFVASLPNQCHRLVTTAIQNSKLIGSLAPHMNLAACSPPMLIDVYKEVSSIPRRHVDLAFVILTKFNVHKWLRETRPKMNERSQLNQIIWKALLADGFSPEEERLMVHDTYRDHLRSLLSFDFPQSYGEILALLLEGSEQNKVSPQLWYDFMNELSKNCIRFSIGMDPFMRKREAKRFATEASVLAFQEVLETSKFLSRRFTEERLANGLYGLFSKYRSYIEPISCFLQMIGYSVIAYTLKNSKGILSQNIADAVWPLLKDLYAPWILPYNQKFIQEKCSQWIQHMNFDATNVLQPWISSDAEHAMIVVNDFTDCVMFLVETLPGNSIIFSYLWNFYVDNFALIGVKEHVVGVVHNCFVSIPWAMFWPSFADVELMCKVVEKFLPASHSFLSIVFAQISWLKWAENLNPRSIGKGYAMLLNLTVRLGNDPVARESPTWMKVMEVAETKMNWHVISPNNLEPILNWLVMSIDPRVVLVIEGSSHRMDKALLRLLETACGYGTIPTEHSGSTLSCNSLELTAKRFFFVRSYVRLILSASTKHKNLLETQPKLFEDAIRNLLSEVATSVKRENQSPDFFMSHLKELINLMSNHTLSTIARNAFLGWCNDEKESHSFAYLIVMIQLSCSVIVRPYIVCPLLEILIELCFSYPDTSWSCIREVTVVNPEEFNNFFDISSKDGHYLILYSLLLRRFSKLIEGGVDTIGFFLDLLKNIKPRDTNEESLPLIYCEILKVVIQLFIEANSEKPKNEVVLKHGKKFLQNLAQHASAVGEDKQGWGLLGALGIGKSSQLSTKGRLFAKCLATFIYAQIPVSGEVRIDPGSEGHFLQTLNESTIKPHPEVQPCLEKLENLKLYRQHNDLIECVDFATEFVKDPNNALSSSELFISKLNGYLFSSRFLTFG